VKHFDLKRNKEGGIKTDESFFDKVMKGQLLEALFGKMQ